MAAQDRPKPHEKPQRRETAEPIPDSMENVAAAVLDTPPKKNWRYLNKR